jgi:hypothetical protein
MADYQGQVAAGESYYTAAIAGYVSHLAGGAFRRIASIFLWPVRIV